MNKRRAGEAVLRGGFANEEARARAVNAEPWEPMPGMIKRQCADSGDREQSVHSIMNTDSGDHEHLFAPA